MPTTLSDAASVFPWCSVSSMSDASDEDSVVSSSISSSSFSCLYFMSDTTCIVFYYLAAECGKRRQLWVYGVSTPSSSRYSLFGL